MYRRLNTQSIYLSIAGFCIDIALLWLFNKQGLPLDFSHSVSFMLAFSSCAIIYRMWLSKAPDLHLLRLFITETTIFLLLVFLRGGILTSLMWMLDVAEDSSFLICITISWCIYLVIHIWQNNIHDSAIKRQYLLIFIIAYSVLIRLVYLGTPELFYEEAYYWNYAKHLDIGYLDHPPLIAFIIAFFTNVFGDNEFGVRFGALLCWIITSIFFCRLIRAMFPNKFLMLQSMAILATLPIFFGTGWAMTPDAPLMACWAALLYFLYQALLKDKKGAWIGVGIALGLGMLAKYTIILVSVAVLIVVLVDKNARKWLFRPQPYYAALIAIALFSPVIIWNHQHEWASFLYQSKSHVSRADKFALHYFIASILIILTPTGFLLAMSASLFRKELYEDSVIADAKRVHRNFIILGFVPVIVFAIVSLSHETKFHWTGPAWLAILPFVLLFLAEQQPKFMNKGGMLSWARRAWTPTLLVSLILYGCFFHYLTLGFYKVAYPQQLYLLGWGNFGKEMTRIIQSIEQQSREKLLVVGMDRNRTASGLAFYINKALQNANPNLLDYDPMQQTTSWHLFDRKSLMYEYWFPSKDQAGKILLLVAKNSADLQDRVVLTKVESISEVKRINIMKNDKLVASYYYALARGYHSYSAEKK